MSITQTSKIRVRTGDLADLPQLSPGEFGFATDEKRLFIGNQSLSPFTVPGNTEISTIQTTSTVTFSAIAMNVNCQLANTFTVTLTANVTVAPTFSNPGDGQTIRWFITQDATGNRTIVWPTSFKWPAATPGVLSTAANSVDLLTATYVASTSSWYATLTKNFA